MLTGARTHASRAGVVNRGPDTSGPPPLPASAGARLSGGWGPLLPFEAWPTHAELAAALPATKQLIEQDIDFMARALCVCVLCV